MLPHPVHSDLIKAYLLVKKACALTNQELGFLENAKAAAIIAACEKEPPVVPDALQGGAGTATNMAINEWIAQSTGTHPLHDVNLHQSTNDTYPTALKIAAIYKLRELSTAIAGLQNVFQQKEKEYADIPKIGRTEMQEAVPMTLGREFGGWSEALGRDRWRTFKCEERLRIINLGGTAIGTGLAAPTKYIFKLTEKIQELTGLPLARGENLVGETANADCFVEVSGILKAHAANVSKIANDLRLLNLLDEIELPKLQLGSSIMPGKVNPVLCEAAIQVAITVAANDQIIFDAASRGSLQINEFLPLVAQALLETLDLLTDINQRLVPYIAGIVAHPEKCQEYLNKSPTIATAFVPHLGYEKTEKLIKDFLAEKLGKDTVEKTLSPQQLNQLGFK
jgi:aspartate ammonia-lyase